MTPSPAATEAVTPASAVDAAEVAGRFGQALVAVQADDKAGNKTATDSETDEASNDGMGAPQTTGDLSAELLAVLLGQQTPQPVTPPVSTDAQAAEAQADILAVDALSVAALAQTPVATPTATSAALVSELSAGLVAELNGEGEEASSEEAFTEVFDSLMTTEAKDTAEAKADSRQTSIEDALQSLSGAMKTADDASATTQTSQTASQTQVQSSAQSLTQMQAQVVPQNDSGVRFTPTPPTAQETVQTYSMSSHTAENIAALSAQISRRLGSKSTNFDMELRPAGMGKVDVKLEIGHDGKLTAQLSFDSPMAESEFKGRQDDLRRQLEQAGFQMDDASLNFASSDQGRGRQFAEAEPGEYEAPATVESEAVSTTEAHTLIDAQLMAAAASDPTLYAQMSAGGYGQMRTLSLSVLV